MPTSGLTNARNFAEYWHNAGSHESPLWRRGMSINWRGDDPNQGVTVQTVVAAIDHRLAVAEQAGADCREARAKLADFLKSLHHLDLGQAGDG